MWYASEYLVDLGVCGLRLHLTMTSPSTYHSVYSIPRGILLWRETATDDTTAHSTSSERNGPGASSCIAVGVEEISIAFGDVRHIG